MNKLGRKAADVKAEALLLGNSLGLDGFFFISDRDVELMPSDEGWEETALSEFLNSGERMLKK